MTIFRLLAVTSGLVTFVGTDVALSQTAGHGSHRVAPNSNSYAGQDARSVTSLSADEVKDYLAGKGMGLAKPAELNGFPGPAHVLELADALGLTPDQRLAVERSKERMLVRAKSAGERYVSAEMAVDAIMRSREPKSADVAARLAAADAVRAEIRMAHIEAHLEITPLLSAEQRMKYAELRGYSAVAASPHKH
jgi:Spy/CpxP family protein refolding chaperone